MLKKWIKKILVCFLDALFSLKKETKAIPEDPKKILICNISSFGDVVISTTVLPVLKRHYPRCEFGFLLSSLAAEALINHPLITHIHCFDHWYIGQSRGWWRGVLQHIKTMRIAVKEIKACKYDLAIDLYPMFRLNALSLLSKAKIPVRIGYPIEGYSNLLTHSISMELNPTYIGQTHLNLLKILKIDVSQDVPFPHYFTLKPSQQELPKDYVVIHMGTSYSLKEWDDEKWIHLVEKLNTQAIPVVLTGKGHREQLRCQYVASKARCLNYCDQLKWSEFASIIQHAKVVISVDSAAIHLAAAVRIPCIVLFAGINSIAKWKPPNPECIALIKRLPCAPCLNSRGCSSMACIREISVEQVLDTLNGFVYAES